MIILVEKKQAIKEGVWAFNGAKALPVINALSKIRKSTYGVIGSDSFFDSLDNAIYEARYLYWLMGKPQSKVTLHNAQPDLDHIWKQIRSLGYDALDKMPPFSWKECKYEFPKSGITEQVSVKAPSGKLITGWIKVSEDFIGYLMDEEVMTPEEVDVLNTL
jgi:hypothetical protein